MKERPEGQRTFQTGTSSLGKFPAKRQLAGENPYVLPTLQGLLQLIEFSLCVSGLEKPTLYS